MVVYIVCFDLEQDHDDQVCQIEFWLEFLSSTLPGFLPSSTVMISGLKSDVKHASTSICRSHIQSWQNRFRNLFLFKSDLFTISSIKSKESVSHLLQCVEGECKRIFESHSTAIPKPYLELLQSIKQMSNISSSSSNHFTSPSELPSCGLDEFGKKLALRYFHSTGHIVLLDDNTVCINPTSIPKIVAKFISPKEVTSQLLTTKEITFLTDNQIDCLFDIQDTSNER
jgi:hypothetical protein